MLFAAGRAISQPNAQVMTEAILLPCPDQGEPDKLHLEKKLGGVRRGSPPLGYSVL